jgi:hypothetical protein
MEAVGPHVSALVETALAEARRHIYDALRVDATAPEEWRSVDTRAAADPETAPAPEPSPTTSRKKASKDE